MQVDKSITLKEALAIADDTLRRIEDSRVQAVSDSDADSLTVAELIEQSYSTAKEKGWWDAPRNQAECIALMHSELSEALEELRRAAPPLYTTTDAEGNDKPEGVAAELADLLIRVADFCGGFNIPLEEALRMKLAYNRSRPYRHGCKF